MLLSPSKAAVLLPVVTLYVHAVLPFFVYNHHTLTRTRLDPLIQPGEVSAHTHVFAGSNHVTADANYESITAGDCTTSPITNDKSLYWAPQLYYKDEEGKYHVMSGDGLVTYWFYHRGPDDPDSYPELPDDFRMVAGNMKRDSLDMSRAEDQAVSFQCFGEGYDFRLPYIPADIECDTIRPQVGFPNCWDGVNSYKEDGSHVAYGEGDYEYGKCPDGFKRIPSLFLEAYYKPKYMIGEKYKWRPGCLVFAHGDNFGLTFHADWMNGFAKGVLNEAYDQCKTVLDGTVDSCPYFTDYINPEESRDCSVYGQIANEPVGSQTPLDHLPGNNVEYNSSALANQPKEPDPNYQENANLVDIVEANGGICKSQHCTDYTGPQDGQDPGVPGTQHTSASGVSIPTKTLTSIVHPAPTGLGSKPAQTQTQGQPEEQVVIVAVYETVYVTAEPPVAPASGTTTGAGVASTINAVATSAVTTTTSCSGSETTHVAVPSDVTSSTGTASIPGGPAVVLSDSLIGITPRTSTSGVSDATTAGTPTETGRCNRKRMAACP